MAIITNVTGKDAFEIADTFAQLSARILEYRVSHRDSISHDDAVELEMCEDRLDQAVVLFRGYGIQLLGEKAEEAIKSLKESITEARSTLTTIENIKSTIKIAGSLVNMTLAILSKDPAAVLGTLKEVKEACEAVKAPGD